MLVLSRKVGESIQIGEKITLVVTRVIGNRVTFGFEAPSDVRIVRSELLPQKKDETRSSRHNMEPVPKSVE